MFWIKVMLSPFINILPSARRFCFFTLYSSAASNTTFIYSSNPITCPSILVFRFSNNQRETLDRFCKYLKIRLTGCSINFCTLCGPEYICKVYWILWDYTIRYLLVFPSSCWLLSVGSFKVFSKLHWWLVTNSRLIFFLFKRSIKS